MTEHFILGYVPQRVKQLGYGNYHIRYRDIKLGPSSSERIIAYNELYFIVDDPQGLIVESDYGLYDSTPNQVNAIFENIHQHRGEIIIKNPGETEGRIKFIQVIIVN